MRLNGQQLTHPAQIAPVKIATPNLVSVRCAVGLGSAIWQSGVGEHTRGDETPHTTHPSNVGEVRKLLEAGRFEVPVFPFASWRLCVEISCQTGTATIQNLTQRRQDAKGGGLEARSLFSIWVAARGCDGKLGHSPRTDT